MTLDGATATPIPTVADTECKRGGNLRHHRGYSPHQSPCFHSRCYPSSLSFCSEQFGPSFIRLVAHDGLSGLFFGLETFTIDLSPSRSIPHRRTQ